MRTKVSVVILNWNGLALLKKFLPGVIKYTSQTGYEVVVADNGSTDHSLQYIKSTFPTVKTIDLGLNHGFAEGYNRALAQLDAEYFVLLNSDVDVTEQWLEPMVNLMDNNPDVAACGPKILHQQRPEFFEYAGAAGGFIDRYGYPFCRGRIFDFVEKDNGQYDNQIDCLWVSGCCLMVRATDYKLHGGLDGQFFAHMEEIDLCWRFNNNNKRVVFTPDSVVYHVGGASLDASHPKKTYLNFRNSLLCIYKNLTPNIFWISYVVRIPLDMLAAVKMAMHNGPEHAKAILQAHRDFNDLRHKTIRSTIKHNTIKKRLVTTKLMVLEYYLLKHKRYSEIFRK